MNRYTSRLLILTVLSWQAASANNIEPKSIPYLDSEVTIDGIMDESVWDRALIVPLTIETDPHDNIPARVQTDAHLIDRGDALLVAFRAQDPEPDKIRAYLRDRDSAYRDDFVGIIIDTFNDERRALEFFSNPFGAQMDLIQDDVNGNEDDSWNAIWESAGKITDFGFVVEMEIPYSQMQLPAVEGEQTWGIGLIRKYPRDSRYNFSNKAIDRNIDCFLCQLDKFTGFANAEQGRDLEITPTLVAIGSQNRDELTDPDLGDTEFDFEPGVDINWGITPNITLNGTINPDFSQIEADVAQLDVNTTFALFFPERRPFFLENADLFSTPIRAVFTRNVADPDYGVRLVGKTGANNYGFFFAEDTVTNFVVPGVFGSSIASLDETSTDTVLRYRRDVLDNSTVGLLYTERDSDSYNNRVAGIDGQIRFSDTNSLRFQYLDTDTEYPDNFVEEFDQVSTSLSGSGLFTRLVHDSRNWFGQIRYEDYDDGFRTDLGFVNRIGFNRWVVGGSRRWIGKEEDWFRRISIYSDWDITHDQDGRVLERELEGNFNMSLPMQSFVEIFGGSRERLFDDILFDETFYGFYGEIQPRSGLRLQLSGNFGDQIDFANSALGEQTRYRPSVDLSVGKHWNFNLRHTYSNLERESRDVFTANQSDFRIGYQFDLKQRLRLTLQYTNVERDPSLYVDEVDEEFTGLSTQLIYSYKVNPRTVLFVGYSDSGQETDEVNDLTTTNKTLFVKWSYAWTPS